MKTKSTAPRCCIIAGPNGSGKTKTKPESELAKNAAQALKRAAKRARATARQFGTPIHVQTNGTVIALKP